MRELINLFFTFAQLGAVTFGGGYAMLPILQREIVEKHNWATEEELADYYAIGQCTPGVIAVNTATFIGYKRKGIVGGIVATLGVVFPSVVIISIIAAFISNFSDYEIVEDAFSGIRVCVCVLILNSVIKLMKKSVVDKATMIIFLIIFAISVVADISSVYLVVAAGVMGLFIGKVGGKK